MCIYIYVICVVYVYVTYMYKTTVLSKLGNKVVRQIIEILLSSGLSLFFANFDLVLFYYGDMF